MGKGVKVLIVLVAVVLAIVVGLSVFLRLYLTEDRIRALVIPYAEGALGRKVAMGEVRVGLLRGVTLKDLVIKEQDGISDFLRVPGFVLRFELLPLLRRELVVTEVELLNPSIRILRDASGRFNFETLKFLQEEPRHGRRPAGPRPKGTALPLALTVREVRVKGAKVSVKDAFGGLPEADVEFDLHLALALGRGAASFTFEGDTSFEARMRYGEVEGRVKGRGKFDQREASWSMVVEGLKERIEVKGRAEDYLRAPRVVLNLFAEGLEVEDLLAAKEKLPRRKRGARAAKGAGGAPTHKGRAIPLPGLEVSGEAKVGRVLYRGLEFKDLVVRYRYDKGVLRIKELLAGIAQGEVKGQGVLDLRTPQPRHEAKLELTSVQLASLWEDLIGKGKGAVTGTLRAELTSRGQGLTGEALRRWLDARGTYSLREGRLLDFKPLVAAAAMLGLRELRDLSFKELKGNFRVVKGKVLIKGTLDGPHLRAKADGEVGLDGSLNLPLVLELSPRLGEKLRRRVKFARYLVSKGDWTAVPLVLKGTVERPRPVLDEHFVKIGVKRALEDLLKKEQKKAFPQEIFKGLFGQ